MSDSNVTINSGTKDQVALELTRMVLNYDHPKNGEDILAAYKKCQQAVYS